MGRSVEFTPTPKLLGVMLGTMTQVCDSPPQLESLFAVEPRASQLGFGRHRQREFPDSGLIRIAHHQRRFRGQAVQQQLFIAFGLRQRGRRAWGWEQQRFRRAHVRYPLDYRGHRLAGCYAQNQG